MAQVSGLNVRQWATGYGHETDTHFVKLDFVNGTSVTVSLSADQAKEIAEALLQQLHQKPPKPDRLS
jgi:hypothetical protein